MYINVSKYDFFDAFKKMGREKNFSYEGLEVLYNYLTELEKDIGEKIELDIVGLCCEYYESTVEEIADDCNIEIEDDADEDERREAVRKYLENEGVLVGEVPGGFVYEAF